MIDTGHTVKLAAEVLKEAGAKDIYVLICHGSSGFARISPATSKLTRDHSYDQDSCRTSR